MYVTHCDIAHNVVYIVVRYWSIMYLQIWVSALRTQANYAINTPTNARQEDRIFIYIILKIQYSSTNNDEVLDLRFSRIADAMWSQCNINVALVLYRSV